MNKNKGIEFTGVFKKFIHRGEVISLWEFHSDCGSRILIGVRNEFEEEKHIQIDQHCSIIANINIQTSVSENNITFMKNRVYLLDYEAIEQQVM